ncbi:MAG: hypothetical protein QF682_03320, partial [Candidatus Thermoplasmatota archaeon]|nr:hypothetical protein [Candidatus Thermoplasmatota archaeon]
RDHWGGTDYLMYGDKDLNLTLFYNYIPSPPSKIWPNSTSDRLPLISWWGALDQETPYEELEYSIQIGTTGVDDNVLPWHNVGHSTSYQIQEELGVGFYHIQVKSFDGEFYSEISSSVMTISLYGNHPPGVPGTISPLYTVRRDPTITWGASTDKDVNDLIEYFITIGTDWHGTDIIKSTPTSVNTMYQLPFMLPYGTYYVQVVATDGYEFSPVRELRMIIFDPSDNIAPFPPSSLTPRETRNPSPLIRWEGAVDLNGDSILFWFRMGSGPDQGDLIPWRSTGDDNFYQIEDSLSPGYYYVQVKCYDGNAFSGIFEGVVHVKGAREIAGPSEIALHSSTDPTPLLNWSGAHYKDSPGGDEIFSYYIRLGSEPLLGDILGWSLVSNATSYQVEAPLMRGEIIYVEIKAFDGHQYSEISFFTLRISEFQLTVGFNETNYLYMITDGTNQTIRAFIKNTGRDDVTVELGVGGAFSKYVKTPAGALHIKSGEMVSVLLTVDIPDSANVNRDSTIVLIATSADGASARSELLGFKREDVVEETWSDALGMNFNLILGIIVLLLALFILLILIIKRAKRGKRERFEVIDVRKRSEAVVIDDLIPTSIYSTQRLSERRTFEALDQTLVAMFKAHGIRTKPRVKGHRGKALPDGKGGKKTPALPPPAPGELTPDEMKIMPPPPGERVEFLPPGDDVPGSELPPAPEMEYIPPEGAGKGPLNVTDVIVDAEEIPADLPEPEETSDVVDESEAEVVSIPFGDAEGDAELPEEFAEDTEDVSTADVEDDEDEVPTTDIEDDEDEVPTTDIKDDEDEVPTTDVEDDAEPHEEVSEGVEPEQAAGGDDDSEPEELAESPEAPPVELDIAAPSDDVKTPMPPVSVNEEAAPESVEKKEKRNSPADEDSSALDDIMDILGIDED